MFIVAASIEIRIPGCNNLKDKRKVVRSIIGRNQARHHLSSAEVCDQAHHSIATIGMVYVSGSRAVSNQVIEAAIQDIETRTDCEIYRIELFEPET